MQSIPEDATVIAPPATARSVANALTITAVVIAALYFGRELLVPLVLATILAFVLAPACWLLQRTRLPRVVSVLLVVLVTFAVLGGIGLVVGRQIASLADNLPSYETTVMGKWKSLSTGGGILQHLLAGSAPAGKAAVPTSAEAASALGLENASGLVIARTLAQPLLGPLTTAGVVLVFTIFILISNEDLRDRLVRLVGRRDLHRTILALNDAARRLSRYFLFQLLLNGSFGIIIGLSLWLAGLPNPILWGILAALMRFVPFIGTFIAVVPPLLLALAVVPGWTLAIVVFALFIGTDLVIGQVVEPLIYGHSTGMSPIAVIVATAFWAFLWGPIGLLLATPLTVCLVVMGRHVQPLAFLDVILGDTPPLEPAETFYQRALEGKANELVAGARLQIGATSRTDYYDSVAVRGLALAQADLSRDALAFERLEEIHGQITGLISALDDGDQTTPSSPAATPDDWKTDGALVCIPGRGQLDDLAAIMAQQSLRSSGFGATTEPNLMLGTAREPSTIDLSYVRLCCLSVIEGGSSASGIRYFVRRIQKKMPDAVIVVGLWQASGDSQLLAELRSTGEEEHLVRSIGELVALAQALAARKGYAAG